MSGEFADGPILSSKILEDAWRTFAPARGHRDGPLPPLLLTLTFVTGLVDAFSYLVLGHVFVANMTGNVVFLAFALAGAPGFSAPASLLALGAFLVGAGFGGRLGSHLGFHRGRLLGVTALLETVLLATGLGLAASSGSPGSGAARYILILLLASAMGAQNAAARRVAVHDLTTTVLTLTMTGIASDSRVAGGQESKLGRRGLAIATMFLGALVGSFALIEVADALTIAFAVIATSIVAVVALSVSRSGGNWSEP